MHNQAQPLNTSSTKEEKKMPYSIGSALKEKVDPSNALLKQRSKRRIYRGLLITMLLLLLLSGCGNDYSSIPTIEGRNLEDSSRAIDEQHKQQIVLEQSEKYIRHYQNGLYFEDLSKEQKELNDLFNRHIRQEIEECIAKEAPFLKDVPYALQTEVEYVNQDVKDYAEGKKKAEDIIDNPNSMMKVIIRWYIFKDFLANEEIRREGADLEYTEYIQSWKKYIREGVDYVEIWIQGYDPSALNKYSIQEIEKSESVPWLLQDINGTMDLYLLESPKAIYQERDGLDGIGTEKDPTSNRLGRLKKKYHIDFYSIGERWYSPKKYPEVMFRVGEAEYDIPKDHIDDHFQSAMFQYLANQRVRKIIDDAGLSDRVAFLVTAEPKLNNKEGLSTKPYDFGEGFDEDFFLQEGYAGYVDITLIYLEDENKKEGLSKEQIWESALETSKEIEKKIVIPMHEKIRLGDSGSKIYVEGSYGGSSKETHVYKYYVSDYDRKVIIDLFKKYPLTECEWNPNTSTLADVFSLQYITRAETPGFHYLDVFGGESKYNNFDEAYVKENYTKKNG